MPSSSTPETSSSGSEVGTSAQFPPNRGTTLASKRKGTLELPQGAVLMGGPDDDTGVVDTGEFDWSSVKDEDIELWLVRVPNSVRLFFNPSIPLPLLPTFSYRTDHRFRPRLVFIPKGWRKGTLIERFLSKPSPSPSLSEKYSVRSRSNPNISTMPFSMPPPRRLHILLARSRKNTRYTTSGLSVTATTMTSIVTRSAATR